MNGHKHAPRGRIKAVEGEAVEPSGGLMDAPLVMDTKYTSCTAKSKQSGVRCRRRPIPGGTVCKIHGGGTPLVRQKAEERLAALVDPALTRLGELIAQKEYPSTAITAVNSALDRAMGKAIERQAVKVQGTLVIRHEIGE